MNKKPLVLMILGIINAAEGKAKELPFIGVVVKKDEDMEVVRHRL